MRRNAIAVFTACLIPAGAALADEPVRYTKPETEQFVVGKRITYVRTKDGNKSSWDFKVDRTVFYSTSGTTRNIQVAGTYEITDRGSVCMKWTQDKYVALQDGCFAFVKDGDRIHVTAGNDTSRVIGDVVD